MPDCEPKQLNAREQRIAEIRASKLASQGDLLESLNLETPPEPEKSAPSAKHEPSSWAAVQPSPPLIQTPKRSRKERPPQGDFYAPLLYDVGAKDNRAIMDVAVFRLSKSDLRANTILRYEIPDGHVEVASGPYGMASVWDYDIVLMAVSHLTEAMNLFREGKGPKPGQTFTPHIGDILHFCRKDNGGNQKEAVVGALQRLYTTNVTIERLKNIDGEQKLITEGEGLIGPFKVISNPRTKKTERLQIKVADWMYQEITKGLKPDVLTVNPDYFLINQGLGRFLYRLARRAAGKDQAAWNFGLLFERSGSKGTRKEFNRLLRSLIKANDLPDYSLAEEQGKTDFVLRMVHRGQQEQWAVSGD
jgi:plasmid replication initiation protein